MVPKKIGVIFTVWAVLLVVASAQGYQNAAHRSLEGEYDCFCTDGVAYCSDTEAISSCHCDGDFLHCSDHDDHGDDHGDGNDSGDKPWGTVIGASLIINLSTLSGIFILGGHWIRKAVCRNWQPKKEVGNLWAELIIPMFACGALLGTTFFLLLPEALHMIQAGLGGGHDDHGHRLLEGDEGPGESATTWRFGSSVMGGFLIPVLLQTFFPHSHNHSHGCEDSCQEDGAETPEKEPSSDETPEKSTSESDKLNDDDEYMTICGCVQLKNLSLFISMNFGELLHNFTDGIFVGAAYLGCGPAVGNSVVAATVFHEIPNQLAGYLVMVNQNGINPFVALVLNFLFGLSVLAGAILVLLAEPGKVAVGCIFCIGGGIFLHVAISEMLGTAERYRSKKIHFVYVIAAFMVGAVPIGLVLLDHEHCGGH